MKKIYYAPEMELLEIKISKDILGDSQPEPSLPPVYETTIEDDF